MFFGKKDHIYHPIPYSLFMTDAKNYQATT